MCVTLGGGGMTSGWCRQESSGQTLLRQFQCRVNQGIHKNPRETV